MVFIACLWLYVNRLIEFWLQFLPCGMKHPPPLSAPFWPASDWTSGPWTLCVWSPAGRPAWRRPTSAPSWGPASWNTSRSDPEPLTSGRRSKKRKHLLRSGRAGTANTKDGMDICCTSLLHFLTLRSMSYRSSSTKSICLWSFRHSSWKWGINERQQASIQMSGRFYISVVETVTASKFIIKTFLYAFYFPR